MLRVIEYFAKSLKVIRNYTLEYGVCTSLSMPLYLCLRFVPFVRYSASNNGVTSKSWLVVVQGHENGARPHTTCYKFATVTIYSSILYHFSHNKTLYVRTVTEFIERYKNKARYWLKIAIGDV